jgi:hypothetical protein
MKYWVTKEGLKIKPQDMEDSHIINAFKYFNKKYIEFDTQIGWDITDFIPLTPEEEKVLSNIENRLKFLKDEAKIRNLKL